jgi:hypothetical protein
MNIVSSKGKDRKLYLIALLILYIAGWLQKRYIILNSSPLLEKRGFPQCTASPYDSEGRKIISKNFRRVMDSRSIVDNTIPDPTEANN